MPSSSSRRSSASSGNNHHARQIITQYKGLIFLDTRFDSCVYLTRLCLLLTEENYFGVDVGFSYSGSRASNMTQTYMYFEDNISFKEVSNGLNLAFFCGDNLDALPGLVPWSTLHEDGFFFWVVLHWLGFRSCKVYYGMTRIIYLVIVTRVLETYA